MTVRLNIKGHKLSIITLEICPLSKYRSGWRECKRPANLYRTKKLGFGQDQVGILTVEVWSGIGRTKLGKTQVGNLITSLDLVGTKSGRKKSGFGQDQVGKKQSGLGQDQGVKVDFSECIYTCSHAKCACSLHTAAAGGMCGQH
jgi:hypothetical protein